MPPFISPESVKELNEVMCVTNDNWIPIPMYCSNCGELLYGYRNDEGKIKYECKRCGAVAVRVPKGRRHNKIDLYAPEGQIADEPYCIKRELQLTSVSAARLRDRRAFF